MLRHRTIGLGGAVLGALMAANGIFGGLLAAGGTFERFRETYRLSGQRAPTWLDLGLENSTILAGSASAIGLALLVGGVGLLRHRHWGRHLLRLAFVAAALVLGAGAAGMELRPALLTLGCAVGGLVLAAWLSTRTLALEVDRAGWIARREDLDAVEPTY
ncbi:MAG: hypothetical protein R3F20_06600 [Planctomycetota bacterium]